MTEFEKTVSSILGPELGKLASVFEQAFHPDAAQKTPTNHDDLAEAYKIELDAIKPVLQQRCAEINGLRKRMKELEERLQNSENLSNHRRDECTRLRRENDAANAQAAATINKLHKDYSACASQRDAFRRTVESKEAEITGLKQQIAKKALGEAKSIMVDGIEWTPNDIRNSVDISVKRAATIDELRKKGSNVVLVGDMYYSPSDVRSLLNTIKQLRDENAALKSHKPIIEVDGHKFSADRIRRLAAENAHLIEDNAALTAALGATQDSYVRLNDRCNKEEKKRRKAEAKLNAIPLQDNLLSIPSGRTQICIDDPEDVTIQIAGKTFAAKDIPQMADDLVRLTKQVEEVNTINKEAAANSIDLEIAKNKKIRELEAAVKRRDIELRIMRGRAAAVQPEPAIVNTCIGLLSITPESFAKLDKRLLAYREKITSLTNFLEKWSKS